jgi:hypothetical protein
LVPLNIDGFPPPIKLTISEILLKVELSTINQDIKGSNEANTQNFIFNTPHTKTENSFPDSWASCFFCEHQIKNTNFLEDNPMNIPTKFGSN